MNDTERAAMRALPVIGLLSIAYGLFRVVALGESPMLIATGSGAIAVWLALRAEADEDAPTEDAADTAPDEAHAEGSP